VVLLLAGAAPGCRPDAAASNRPAPEDAFPPNRVLAPGDEARVLGALQATAEGEPARPLVPAPGGYRWTDVPGALRAAAGACFAGVASISQKDDEVVAALVLDDGQRGTAIATRQRDGVAVVVHLGVFGQPAREAEFERAFQRALRQMGAARKPQASE
jgi:hypothetical protein